jgi:hypothetical protein
VTARPKVVAVGEAVSTVELGAGTIVCVTGEETLGVSLRSPAYAAVIKRLPTASVLVVNVA